MYLVYRDGEGVCVYVFLSVDGVIVAHIPLKVTSTSIVLPLCTFIYFGSNQ